MNREIEIHVDLDGQSHLVGRLWSQLNKGREGASFVYDPSWLASPLRFPLEPALSLDPGSHHTRQGHSLFGALGDSAPDRWGRMLMKRMERRTAERRSKLIRRGVGRLIGLRLILRRIPGRRLGCILIGLHREEREHRKRLRRGRRSECRQQPHCQHDRTKS